MSNVRTDGPGRVETSTVRTEGRLDATPFDATIVADPLKTSFIHRLSWGAILAGVVVGLVVQLILNLIGVGVGAGTLDPGTGDNPAASTFSIGAGVWWVVSGLIASLVGGYTAGQLSGRSDRSVTGWHGVTTWALTTLVIVYLLTSAAGGLIGGAMSTVTGAMGGMGKIASTAAQTAAPSLANANDPFSSIEHSVRDATGGNDPAALKDAAVASMRAAVTGDEGQAQQAREGAAQALAKAQSISIEDARTRVGQYEQQYKQTLAQAKAQATAAADTAASVVSKGSLLAALALLLGSIAGWLGGRLGTVRPEATVVTHNRV